MNTAKDPTSSVPKRGPRASARFAVRGRVRRLVRPLLGWLVASLALAAPASFARPVTAAGAACCCAPASGAAHECPCCTTGADPTEPTGALRRPAGCGCAVQQPTAPMSSGRRPGETAEPLVLGVVARAGPRPAAPVRSCARPQEAPRNRSGPSLQPLYCSFRT